MDQILIAFAQPIRDNAILVLVALTMTLVDFCSGFIAAWVRKQVKSNKLRAGIVHKLANVAFITVGSLLDTAIGTGKLLGCEPVLIACCVYLIVMEAISINENIKRGNPEMEHNPLDAVLSKAKDAMEDEK